MSKKKKAADRMYQELRGKLEQLLSQLEREGDRKPKPESVALFNTFLEQAGPGLKEMRALAALMEMEVSTTTVYTVSADGRWDAVGQQVTEPYLFQDGVPDLQSYMSFKLKDATQPTIAVWFLGTNLLPGHMWSYVGLIAHSDGPQFALTISEISINLASLDDTTEAELLAQALHKATLEFEPYLKHVRSLLTHPKICSSVAEELKLSPDLVASVLKETTLSSHARSALVLGAQAAVSSHLPCLEQAMLLLLTAQKHIHEREAAYESRISELASQLDEKLEAAKNRFKQDLDTQKSIASSLSERAQRLSRELQTLRAVNEEINAKSAHSGNAVAPHPDLGARLDALF